MALPPGYTPDTIRAENEKAISQQREKEYTQLVQAIDRGESVLIVGLTHSGKTTMMRKCASERAGIFGHQAICFLVKDTSQLLEAITDEMDTHNYPTINGRPILYLDELDMFLIHKNNGANIQPFASFMQKIAENFIIVASIHNIDEMPSYLTPYFTNQVRLNERFYKLIHETP